MKRNCIYVYYPNPKRVRKLKKQSYNQSAASDNVLQHQQRQQRPLFNYGRSRNPVPDTSDTGAVGGRPQARCHSSSAEVAVLRGRLQSCT